MNKEIEITSHSESETILFGEELGKSLKGGSIVALIGDLGAGKTVITKGIARGIGLKEEPNSPTFVIMNHYEGEIPLYHFDLYRISDIDELEGIGYKDFFFSDGISVVEWADKIIDELPKDTVIIHVSIIEGDGNFDCRKFKIKGNEKWLSLFKNMVEQAFQTSKKLKK